MKKITLFALLLVLFMSFSFTFLPNVYAYDSRTLKGIKVYKQSPQGENTDINLTIALRKNSFSEQLITTAFSEYIPMK